jgi:hypothetical protein
MKFSTRRALAAIVASSCLAIPASASAMLDSPHSTTTNDAAALAQERYYSSYDDSGTIDGGTSAAQSAAALAQERYYSSYDGGPSAAEEQERYYSSYGKPEPLTVAQSPAPTDDTPWLPLALSAAVALAIATQVRRLRVRRRVTRVAT